MTVDEEIKNKYMKMRGMDMEEIIISDIKKIPRPSDFRYSKTYRKNCKWEKWEDQLICQMENNRINNIYISNRLFRTLRSVQERRNYLKKHDNVP